MQQPSIQHPSHTVGLVGGSPCLRKLALFLSANGHKGVLVTTSTRETEESIREISEWAKGLGSAGLLTGAQVNSVHKGLAPASSLAFSGSLDIIISVPLASEEADTDWLELLEPLKSSAHSSCPLILGCDIDAVTPEMKAYVKESPFRILSPMLGTAFLPNTWELVSTEENQSTVERAQSILSQWGYRVAQRSASNASLTSIGFLHSLNGACRALESTGAAVDEVDSAMPVAPYGFGPFLTADLLGLHRVMRLDHIHGNVLGREALQCLTRLELEERGGAHAGRGFYSFASNSQ